MPGFTNDPVVSVCNINAPALQGEGIVDEGVRGISHNAHGGVVGINDWAPADPPGAGGNGGWFESSQGEGVRGWSKTPHHGGVVGVNTAGGVGVYGEGRIAGLFKGSVEITGNLQLGAVSVGQLAESVNLLQGQVNNLQQLSLLQGQVNTLQQVVSSLVGQVQFLQGQVGNLQMAHTILETEVNYIKDHYVFKK